MPTIDPHVESADLSSYTQAWNSGDIRHVRALYASEARYFTESTARNLSQGESSEAAVSDAAFTRYVAERSGLQMRILGVPVKIFDKLVAFAFRWENSAEGYDGTALLRYEDDKILLQMTVLSDHLTSNTAPGFTYAKPSDFGTLMQAWNQADTDAIRTLYRSDAVVLSDEDLLQAPWRDFSTPPTIEKLLPQFTGWDPGIISESVQLQNMVVFAWRWKNRSYPAGYGVRLLRYDQSLIATDIRFAIRPWEADGNHFMNP